MVPLRSKFKIYTLKSLHTSLYSWAIFGNVTCFVGHRKKRTWTHFLLLYWVSTCPDDVITFKVQTTSARRRENVKLEEIKKETRGEWSEFMILFFKKCYFLKLRVSCCERWREVEKFQWDHSTMKPIRNAWLFPFQLINSRDRSNMKKKRRKQRRSLLKHNYFLLNATQRNEDDHTCIKHFLCYICPTQLRRLWKVNDIKLRSSLFWIFFPIPDDDRWWRNFRRKEKQKYMFKIKNFFSEMKHAPGVTVKKGNSEKNTTKCIFDDNDRRVVRASNQKFYSFNFLFCFVSTKDTYLRTNLLEF
jgi:NAD-dependent dihydropyrimidine dehydrogenase PreA subunit